MAVMPVAFVAIVVGKSLDDKQSLFSITAHFCCLVEKTNHKFIAINSSVIPNHNNLHNFFNVILWWCLFRVDMSCLYHLCYISHIDNLVYC